MTAALSGKIALVPPPRPSAADWARARAGNRGCGRQRLRLRPFDPSRDTLTDYAKADARLLAMFSTLGAAPFGTEDSRAFFGLFAACVRAGQVLLRMSSHIAV